MPIVLLSHAQRHGYPILFYVKEDKMFYIFRDVKRIMDWGVQKYDKRARLKVMKFDISYGRKYVFTEDEQTSLETFIKPFPDGKEPSMKVKEAKIL
jgi:6-pyruvoyl-tetrahydropterin synthase